MVPPSSAPQKRVRCGVEQLWPSGRCCIPHPRTSAAGINGWAVEWCQLPVPLCSGGVYEPWEEAFVKVWDWRRWLTAKPAVLCNVMCGAGSQGSLCLSVSEVPARGCIQAIREQEEEPLLAKELGGGNPAGKTALNGVFKDMHTPRWAVAHGCQSVGLLSPITITLLQKTHGWLFVSATKGLSVSTVSSQPMGEGGGRLAQHH